MPVVEWEQNATATPVLAREEMFDKHYFHGGDKVGGYACDQFGRAYSDFPVHEITFRHVMARHPKSVLEVGAARGYIVKRLQDQGIPAAGLEISRHCYLTRVADGITQWDLCSMPWPVEDKEYDLCFSIAVMEHVPLEFLPAVIGEMARTCERGFHGIDFGSKDDGWDQTHCSLRPRDFWIEAFKKYAPGWPVEIVDKEELERGEFPLDVVYGDGKVKVNVGSHVNQFHHGWINLDILKLDEFAAANHYNFQQVDVRHGLPFQTGTVDLIFSHHFLEHLSYTEGLSFLRECRRVIKPTGAMRLVVPDAERLCELYSNEPRDAIGNRIGYIEGKTLENFDEINDGCDSSSTAAGKLWSLLFAGHQAGYDAETLSHYLAEAGWEPHVSTFRDRLHHDGIRQILRETTEMFADLSLFMDATPATEAGP